MKKTLAYLNSFVLCFLVCSCDDFLNREPESSLTPGQYLTTESNISSYSINLYQYLPSHGLYSYGTFEVDTDTDNMASYKPDAKYAPGYWLVPQTGGDYYFSDIYQCNWFLDNVLPLYEAGKISGSSAIIDHCIGEVYFFRALCYFSRLKALGDFPIVKTCLEDNLAVLTAASKREPRNEVARFIIDDLTKAINLLGEVPPSGNKTRLSKDCARLFLSRVALYEGTWLKYFKGTAFVPNGPGWPGKDMAYNANYQFPSGSLDNEVDYFLGLAMEQARIVADKYTLVENTGTFQQTEAEAANPYFDMFASFDMSGFSEVLLYKKYSYDQKLVHSVSAYASQANNGHGTTKSMVDAFLMQNGYPIYALGSGYYGDTDLHRITIDRDTRLQVFLKQEGNRNFFDEAGDQGTTIEPWPDITCATYNRRYTTGYCLRKGMNHEGDMASFHDYTGCLVYRASEAYLNYIEACYEKTGTLDGPADAYWRALRKRAGINEDYNVTITRTDMAKEAETDWGAYSGGQLVDATLFNIRRERRCELMAEGLRSMDLHRWRSMDQMIDTPYHVLGINLWENVNYADIEASATAAFVEGKTVSEKTFSKYLAPYHISNNNNCYNGYRWKMAHYLSPIAVQHLIITGSGKVEQSTLYQNPGWPVKAGMGAE